MSIEHRPLGSMDVEDIVIEKIVYKNSNHIKDIVIKFPKGKGYEPETVSLWNCGLVNAYIEGTQLYRGESKEIPYVNLMLYGKVVEVEANE